MPLGDTHIEHPRWHLFLHNRHRATTGHSRRNTHNIRVLFCQRQQLLAEHLLPKRCFRLCFGRTFTGSDIKLAGRMPNGLVVLRRRITFPFLRDDMQHFGPAMVLYLRQDTHQRNHVMPVCRTEIADIQPLEDIARLV